eukprot:GFUD01014438.1.p1 GENE.GFUD01014438.1~~GFUD01014438.1.p1  ORF type:complete len:956 (-),score=217.93 GFUD01014438.1:178-3045(-)
MSKRKLDELEDSEEIQSKLLKAVSSEDNELSLKYEPVTQFDSVINGEDSDKVNSFDEVRIKSEIVCTDIAPAKRISKRSVKKSSKRGKVIEAPIELEEEDVGSKNKRRTWERWSAEDTYIFFEGLNEYGKDFDKLQSHFKSKYKNKRNLPEHYIKNKNQIRHFYYRTWHKILGFISFSKELKNNTKELYGLINYGELWKKIGGTVDEKFGAKLDDMVQKGSATVKIKGKTQRVKTPVCRALKKINNKGESLPKPKNKSKLPSKVVIELRPRDTCDWCRIQKMAQNPHIRVSMGIQRRLGSLINCLEKKWRTHDTKVKTIITSSQEETSDGESYTSNQGGVLVLLPPRGAVIKEGKHRKTENERLKRPKVKIKLAGFEQDNDISGENASRESVGCDTGEGTSKFEEILSMQRQNLDIDTCIEDNSTDLDEPRSSPKADTDTLDILDDDDIGPISSEFYQDFLLDESDHECSRSPIPCEGSDQSETDNADDVKEEEDECKAEFDDDESKVETDGGSEIPVKWGDPKDGWSGETAGNMTVGELFIMLNTEESNTKIKLDYTWKEVAMEPCVDMLSRLLKLASGSSKGPPRGRNNSTSSGGGSPSVRTLLSPLTAGRLPTNRGGLMLSPVGRSGGGAAKQIIMPGGNGVDKPGSPLAIPLDNEHEFRKPLVPAPPTRQGAMSAAFREQIGQYLPKFSNRPGRQRRSRAKQVVGRQLLHPAIQPRPELGQVVQVVNGIMGNVNQIGTVVSHMNNGIVSHTLTPQLVEVVPTQNIMVDNTPITIISGPQNNQQIHTDNGVIINGISPVLAPNSPPQISIPSPQRRSPSPTPSFSCLMDMTFESAPATPTKPDNFLSMYNETENSLLQTPPRPPPTPSPSRCLQDSQDLSLSSWSLNFESPMKSISIPMNFNDDSQNSTISTSSEVDRQLNAMMSENSIDFTHKFARLAKHVAGADQDLSSS